MSKIVEVIKCRATIDGDVKYWIMSSCDDNTLKARQIFEDEQMHQFSIVDTIQAEAADSDALGVFTFVDADMDMPACIAYTVKMNGDNLRI